MKNKKPLLVQIFKHESEAKTNVLSVFLDCEKSVFTETCAFEYSSSASPDKESFEAIEKELQKHKIKAKIVNHFRSYYNGTWESLEK